MTNNNNSSGNNSSNNDSTNNSTNNPTNNTTNNTTNNETININGYPSGNEHPQRVCYKCLMMDMYGNEPFYADLSSALANIPEENRTPSEEYGKRLDICRECEKLYQGMCRGCGCYVELRAAVAKQCCPYERW